MTALREWMCLEVTDVTGRVHRVGSRSAPVETTVAGKVEHRTDTLATATSLTIWSSADAITDFDKFWLKADQALKIEVTVDRGADNGLEELVFVHPANEWFRLADNAALANYSGTLSGGTADVIDEIVVRNESGSDANLEYLIVT